MGVDSSAQSILKSSSSFSSHSHSHSLLDLGYGYLAAEQSRRQPLCGSQEGWGPLSPHRYDFTPCFMDAVVSSVATYGILFGTVAIWWLVKRKQKTQIEKDWHFWTKQVGMAIL
jgi:hypothetical protein